MNPLTDGKPIEGFPAYRVTTDGNIWSAFRWDGRVRKYVIDSQFYLMKFCSRTDSYRGRYRRVILINGNGIRNSRNVHKLILEAFVGPCPEGMQACHNNGNKFDNRLENLRWDTPAANQADRKKHGTAISGPKHYLWKSGIKIGTFKSKEQLYEVRG